MRNQVAGAVGTGLLAVAAAGAALGADSGEAARSKASPAARSAAIERPSGVVATGAAAAQPQANGLSALEKAAKAKRYLFALFWKEEDESTAAMRKTLAAAMKKVPRPAAWAEVNVTDPREKPMVDKFRLDFAPMPLLLAIAPNGVVTAGFPTKVEEKELLDAFATPCVERCLKAFEDRKLVFLCVQNAKTHFSDEAMKGVREFASDERFAGATEIIVVDPADKAEAGLLSDLEIPAATKEAVSVFFAPPGRRVGQFQGATSRDELVEALMAAMSGFG